MNHDHVSQDGLVDPYRARPARIDDARGLHAVLKVFDIWVSGHSDFALEDLIEISNEPGFDWKTDSLVVEHKGEIVGGAMLWRRGREPIYASFGVTHPEHFDRGIGSHLTTFQERRAREIADGEGEATLRAWADLNDPNGMDLLSSRGFVETRRTYTMIAELPGLQLPPDAPQGFRIRRCSPEDLHDVHRLLQEAFAEHWGFVEQSYEHWFTNSYDRQDTDLDLWLLAVAAAEPIGLLIGRPLDDMGWVADLGVLKSWRKKGVGSALLRESLATFKERGCAKAGLGVDAGNESGAVALYERTGMRATRVFISFEKNYVRQRGGLTARV